MEILHEIKTGKFSCSVNGLECSLHYSRSENSSRTLDVYRTYVPEELRGRKIAEKLVEAAIDFARKEAYLLHPTCSYVVMYFRRHRELAPLLDPSTDPENGGSCSVR